MTLCHYMMTLLLYNDRSLQMELSDILPEYYDEDDDIIMPSSPKGESIYIYCMIKDILQNPKNCGKKISILKRQFLFYKKYRNCKLNSSF